jgi:hypothetical protein
MTWHGIPFADAVVESGTRLAVIKTSEGADCFGGNHAETKRSACRPDPLAGCEDTWIREVVRGLVEAREALLHVCRFDAGRLFLVPAK